MDFFKKQISKEFFCEYCSCLIWSIGQFTVQRAKLMTNYKVQLFRSITDSVTDCGRQKDYGKYTYLPANRCCIKHVIQTNIYFWWACKVLARVFVFIMREFSFVDTAYMNNECLAQIRFVINVPKQVTKPKGYVAALTTLILLIRSWTDRDLF